MGLKKQSGLNSFTLSSRQWREKSGDTAYSVSDTSKNSGKNPVDFFPALYPVEYDLVIRRNLTPDPVLSGTDAIIILRTPHLVDI